MQREKTNPMKDTRETLIRHWHLLRYLPRRGSVTVQDIQKKLADEGLTVTDRTIQRDLEQLQGTFPLYRENDSKPYRWSWAKDAPGFHLPGLSISDCLALLMLKQYLQPLLPAAVLDHLMPQFIDAQNHLSGFNRNNPMADWNKKVRVVPPTQPLLPPMIEVDAQRELYSALLHGKQVRITYLKRKATVPHEYRAHLLGLVQRGAIIYLVCTLSDYHDIRLLDLHRVKTAEVLVDPAVTPPDFDLDAYIASGAFGFGANADNCRLEAVFYENAGAHLRETPLSEDQQIEAIAEGQVRVTATVAKTHQLTWWLLGFGHKVEVMAPEGLRGEIAETLKKAAQRYSTNCA